MDQSVKISVITTTHVRTMLPVEVLNLTSCMVTHVSVENYRVESIVMKFSYNPVLITGMVTLSVVHVTVQMS